MTTGNMSLDNSVIKLAKEHGGIWSIALFAHQSAPSMHKLHTSSIFYLCRVADGVWWAEKYRVYARQERALPMMNRRGKVVAVDEEMIWISRQLLNTNSEFQTLFYVTTSQ